MATRSKSSPARERVKERAVVVTTQHRGIFFGYTTDPDDAAVIHLRAGRNVLKWSGSCHGFMGLANMGPVNDSRVGPPADIAIRDITSMALCTDEAVKVWESAPWR
ncbi:MAG: hypothetical protein KDE14_04870 [Rhodobacteraceae bacterium]|nr:hypothetical protein [Paracoccaceae bacterium]